MKCWPLPIAYHFPVIETERKYCNRYVYLSLSSSSNQLSWIKIQLYNPSVEKHTKFVHKFKVNTTYVCGGEGRMKIEENQNINDDISPYTLHITY